LFEQVDLRLGMTLLPEIGEIEAPRASADDGDTHGLLLPIGSILLIESVEHLPPMAKSAWTGLALDDGAERCQLSHNGRGGNAAVETFAALASRSGGPSRR
jgi:hypothetical protein